jgi:hypothetical protein
MATGRIRDLRVDAELRSSTPVSGIAEVALRLARAWSRTDHERWGRGAQRHLAGDR